MLGANIKRLVWLVMVPMLGIWGSGLTQEIETQDTVENRDRPEYDADGMPLGGFRLFPVLSLELQHDNNILAEDEGEISDFVTLWSPGVALRSDWNRHELALGADLTAARYDDVEDEDYTDYSLWGRGTLEFPNARLRGRLEFNEDHEPRTSPSDIGGIEPTEFSTTRANLNLLYKPGRLFVRPEFNYRELDYDATRTEAGVVNNDHRDRDRIDLGIRAGYDVSPNYSVFLEVESTETEYDQNIDDDGFARSSDGFQIVAGSLVGFSDFVFGEFFIGFLDWEYDDPRFEDTDGLTFGADITWNVTPLTTVNFFGSQRIRATTIRGASGIDQTRLGIGVDHELLRNLILSLEVSGMDDDFQDIDRTDDVFTAEIGGRYLMNRYLSLDFGYEHGSRDSSPVDAGGNEYDIDVFFVRLNAQR